MRYQHPHIGIVGYRHSGKTQLARALMDRDQRFTRIPLAGPLKAAAASMCNAFLDEFGIVWGQVTPNVIEANKARFRPFLQWLGTDFAREFIGPDTFWIDRFRAEVRVAESFGQRVICDDMRFPNEAEALRAMGFLIVKIERPEADRLASLERAGEKPETSLHSSETEIAKIVPDVRYLAECRDDIDYLADVLPVNRAVPV